MGGVTETKKTGAPAKVVEPEQSQVYEVKDKDTLTKIAGRLGKKLGISTKDALAEIYRLNPRFDPKKVGGGVDSSIHNKPGQDPDYIRPGDQIKLPAEKTVVDADKAETKTEIKAEKKPEKKDEFEIKKEPPAEMPSETSVATALSPEKVAEEKKKKDDTKVPDDTKKTESPKGDLEGKDKVGSPEKKDPEKEAGPSEKTPEEKKPDGETKGPDEKKGAEKKKKSLFSKILSTINMIFKNPIFQGLMAILATFTGIGVWVCAIGAVLGLISVIGSFIENPKKPPWLAMGTTLLYMAGAFLPGLTGIDAWSGIGAFGGLIGMAMKPDKKKDDDTKPQTGVETGAKPAADDPSKTTKVRTKPLADEEFVEVYNRAAQNAKTLDDIDDAAFNQWLDAVETIAEERIILLERARQAGELTAAEQERLVKINEFLGTQLPTALLSRQVDVAFKLSNIEPSEKPEGGRLYVLREGEDLDSIAKAVAGEEGAAQYKAAIEAYNRELMIASGMRPGTTLYIPNAAQLGLEPAKGWPSQMHLAHPDGGALRNRLARATQYLSGVDTPLARRATELGYLLDKMPVRPEEYNTAKGEPDSEQEGDAKHPS